MFGHFVCFNLRKNEIQMGTHRVNFQSSIHLEFSVIFDVIFLLIFSLIFSVDFPSNNFPFFLEKKPSQMIKTSFKNREIHEMYISIDQKHD